MKTCSCQVQHSSFNIKGFDFSDSAMAAAADVQKRHTSQNRAHSALYMHNTEILNEEKPQHNLFLKRTYRCQPALSLAGQHAEHKGL